MTSLEFWPAVVLAIVVVAWFAFGILFFARKQPPGAPESQRERTAIVGIVLPVHGTLMGKRRRKLEERFGQEQPNPR